MVLRALLFVGDGHLAVVEPVGASVRLTSQ